MRLKHDIELIKKLYIENKGQRNYRNKIMDQYEDIKGFPLPLGTLKDHIVKIRTETVETGEIHAYEPVHVSERYIEVATSELLTPDEIVRLHGRDPSKFELVTDGSTRSKIGTNSNDEGYLINTYSKATFRPRQFRFDEKSLEKILNKIPIAQRKLKQTVQKGTGLLEIPIFDAHFGISTFEDYKSHQEQIANYILSKEWETILFVLGQDTFHNDNFRGNTSKGTLIEIVDIEKAWEDAHAFFQPLIDIAIENAINVEIIYSRGNHDETLGWAFIKTLEKLYPQVKVDSKQSEHKHYIYHDIFLGYTHGDKINDKKIVRYFEALYRLEMAKAKRRIIKRGHLHTLKQFDDNGTQVIALGTANKSDQWHIDNGFVGNHKAFEIFIYSKTSMKAHIFVD